MRPQNPGESFIIRADAGDHMGTGHVMRCLALAQVWHDMGARVTFMTAQGKSGLETHLRSEEMNVEKLSVRQGSVDDAIETRNLAKDAGAKWIVVDGYHFGSEYQRIIKDSGLHLLLIDDMGQAGHCWADIVLNQNIYAHEGLYANRERYTRLLLGTRYVLLRRDFFEWRGWKREIPEVACKVLVTLGGSDPDNVTLKVLNALERVDISDLEVKIVVGPSNPNTQTLENALLSACPVESQEAIHTGAPCSMRILHNVMDMADLIAWADLAVTAGGSTCWEFAFMGVPGVVLVLAGNQRRIAEWLDQAGVMTNLGWFDQVLDSEIADALYVLLCDLEKRHRMSQAGRTLVDGDGAFRVVHAMSALHDNTNHNDELKVRSATMQDAVSLWELASDHVGRMNAFSPEPISLDRHLEWYRVKLSSCNTRIWVLELNGNLVAQIRYDRIDSYTAEIDFAVAPMFRGRGIGTRALALTRQSACKELGVKRLVGVVFESNPSSARVFIKAGFKQLETAHQVCSHSCSIFEWICNGEI